MKLFDLLKDMDSTLRHGFDREITSITIDSRKVCPGALFVCIPGFSVDGHNYIRQAAEKGAAAVLVERVIGDIPRGLTVIQVENTRSALSYVAAAFYGYPAKALSLIGVTGTNGKTSSIYFMEHILNAYGHKPGIIGTVETRVGGTPVDIAFATSTTPDSIELQQIFAKMLEEQADEVVMEVTSHALELHKVDGVSFEVAIFTNLTQDHLDLHGSMNKYKEAKARLFRHSKKAVVNVDDPAGAYMLSCAPGETMTFSIESESDLQAKNLVYSGTGVQFDVEIDGRTLHFDAPIPGRFTVYNILGVIGASLMLGIPAETIQSAVSNLKGVPGRINSVENDKGFGVFVDYAHTPDGLQNIISSVKEFTTGRVLTVFGCGGDRDRTKRPIMGEIAGRLSDFCIITSDNPRSENPEAILDEIEPGTQSTGCAYVKIADRRQAIFHAVAMAAPGDSVIIAGKGHENYQIFAQETIHFDDGEVAAEALASLSIGEGEAE